MTIIIIYIIDSNSPLPGSRIYTNGEEKMPKNAKLHRCKTAIPTLNHHLLDFPQIYLPFPPFPSFPISSLSPYELPKIRSYASSTSLATSSNVTITI